MKLSDDEVKQFYGLYHQLLFFANAKFKIINGVDSVEQFKRIPVGETNKVRDRLYEEPELFNSFVIDNPFNFSTNELTIISSWKDFVKGTFYVFRYLKYNTIFLEAKDTPKAYGVLALTSTFEEMLGPYLPRMVDAVLLPFMDKIIYDSMLLPYPIVFGGGIRRDLNDVYQTAKLNFGIITSLPFSAEKDEQNDADKLRFYLRSKRSCNMYWEEIAELIEKDADLLTLYHREMGRIHARTHRKRLHEIGLSKGWFAILEGMIITGGATKDEVERALEGILSTEKRRYVYIFQLRGKQA